MSSGFQICLSWAGVAERKEWRPAGLYGCTPAWLHGRRDTPLQGMPDHRVRSVGFRPFNRWIDRKWSALRHNCAGRADLIF